MKEAKEPKRKYLNIVMMLFKFFYRFDLKTGEYSSEVKEDWRQDKKIRILPFYGKQEKVASPVFLYQRNKKNGGISRIDLHP